MHQNVTVAEAVVRSCFPPRGPRRRIVYEEGNFPSVRYLYQAQRGADMVVCEDDGGGRRGDRRANAARPDQPRALQDREIQDVEAICARAHEVGALVVLDAYQSLGTVPVDVTALGVDIAGGGSVKWLCGGPGSGLAVRAARPA